MNRDRSKMSRVELYAWIDELQQTILAVPSTLSTIEARLATAEHQRDEARDERDQIAAQYENIPASELNATVKRLVAERDEAREALKPFAALAEVRYPDEGGAPSLIDIMTKDGAFDELELRSHVAASDHIEVLSGEDFRRAIRSLSTTTGGSNV